jgi:hypothetical protein
MPSNFFEANTLYIQADYSGEEESEVDNVLEAAGTEGEGATR